ASYIRSLPTRCGCSFMRSPTIWVISCAPWRRRSRSGVGALPSPTLVPSSPPDDGSSLPRAAFGGNISLQRGQSSGGGRLRAVLAEDIDWKPFPAFPHMARLAIVVGEPSKPGPYVIRVKVPSVVKLMPHKHREDRVYAVISGVFYIGLGDRFDARMLQA